MNTNNLLLKHVLEIAQKTNLDVKRVATILAEAFKKVYLREFVNNLIEVKVDLGSGKINMWRYLKVVEDDYFYNGPGDEDDETLIPFSEAEQIGHKLNLHIKIGDSIKKPININDFDAKTVRNILTIFSQMTSEAVNKQICEKWIGYKGVVLNGTVEKIDETNKHDIRGAVVVINNQEGETTKAYITKNEFVHFYDRFGNRYYENLTPGNTYLFYVKDVHELSSGWPINLSRTHQDIVKHYMQMQIPEIADGSVEVVAISRIAGIKTKVMVRSRHLDIDPIGACLGPKVKRLKAISNLLVNEKIDIIPHSDNEIKNIINALIPAKIIGYEVMDVDKKYVLLITENHENFSAAIGRKGINVRLASMLTGWNIDIKEQSEAREEKIRWNSTEELGTNDTRSLYEKIYEHHKFSKSELMDQDDFEFNSNQSFNYQEDDEN